MCIVMWQAFFLHAVRLMHMLGSFDKTVWIVKSSGNKQLFFPFFFSLSLSYLPDNTHSAPGHHALPNQGQCVAAGDHISLLPHRSAQRIHHCQYGLYHNQCYCQEVCAHTEAFVNKLTQWVLQQYCIADFQMPIKRPISGGQVHHQEAASCTANLSPCEKQLLLSM